MRPESFAVAVGLVIFGGGVIGLILQRLLPETFTTGGPRDMIGAVVGLLTLLSALTMGLLIWTAYGVYAGQNTAIQTLAAKVLQLDLALADFGPDANPERARLRTAVGQAIDDVWGQRESDKDFIAENFDAAVRGLRKEEGDLASLNPSTDAQKKALTLANSIVEAIGQARLQMSFALTNPISYPLILIVVGWATALFCGFGLMSKGHMMSVVVVLVGAIAVSTSVYMILDLSSPYTGVFRPSSAPLEQVLEVMGKE
jgi:hypothetical protein